VWYRTCANPEQVEHLLRTEQEHFLGTDKHWYLTSRVLHYVPGICTCSLIYHRAFFFFPSSVGALSTVFNSCLFQQRKSGLYTHYISQTASSPSQGVQQCVYHVQILLLHSRIPYWTTQQPVNKSSNYGGRSFWTELTHEIRLLIRMLNLLLFYY
jgi:hypothetical protein